MRFALPLTALALVAGCAGTPSMPTQNCSGGVESQVGGQTRLGAGSDGFIGDTDLIFAARVEPGNTGCTTVGGSIKTTR